jgi:hypothetical protein
MHPGWLVESAGMWGYHSAMLAESKRPFETEAVHAYWLRTRVRFDAWNTLLRDLSQQLNSPLRMHRVDAWTQWECLTREVLLAEPLTRIAAAVAMRPENQAADGESCAILHNAFSCHRSLRCRCLKLTLDGMDVWGNSTERINRLRVYLEQWTDMLLGFFADPSTDHEVAHSPDRACEFAEDYSFRNLGSEASTVWSLFLAGNRRWLEQHALGRIPFPALCQEVARTAMGMVHSASFHSLGLPPSKLARRISEHLRFVDRAIDGLLDKDWPTTSAANRAIPSRY